MEPRVFEQLIGELLAALGFEDVEVTKYSGDGGIDVRAVLAVGGVTDIQTAIQVKRWSNNVSGRVVRELRGALGPHEQGLIITLSRFTPDALNEAAAPNRAPIALVNGDRLLDLLMESEIGVTRRRLTIYELDEGLFTDSESEEAEPTKPEGGAITIRRSKRGKPLSVWPLPGGRLVWRTSLDQMLSYVAEQAPTMEEAIGWLISNFDRASSEKVARGYWQVPRTFGLLETQGEHLTLTATGAEYLANSNPQALLDILRANVAGFDELVDYLAERPHRVDELLERLRHDLGVTWETEAQVNFRLGWLENVGAAEADGAYWRQRDRPLVSPG
jgi:restriction endonuclease Mrr